MQSLSLDQLVEALPTSVEIELRADRAKLIVSDPPFPFVAPQLELLDGSDLEADVILVEAPAAVGKSTLARHLSATASLPLLDLTAVRVATGSLAGVLRDIVGPADADDAVLAGELAVVVDGVDEGRLLSGERNFEDFLSSTWAFLADASSHTRPKLVILGRPPTIDYVALSLAIEGEGLRTRRCAVSYFDEAGSRDLVIAYANQVGGEAMKQHELAALHLLDTYFAAVQMALQIPDGRLWADPDGRRFAGYAPVLATLGQVVGQTTNFIELESDISRSAENGAWAVIERVCSQVFDREQGKLRNPLEAKCTASVPAEAYDRTEQVLAAMAHVDRTPVQAALRVTLDSPADTAIYRDDVAAYIPEHPFVQGSGFANDVLGSVLVADAIAMGVEIKPTAPYLLALARQPFLWRAVRHRVDASSLLDGAVVGALLSSYLSDDGSTTLRATEGADAVAVSIAGGEQLFTATPPLTLGDVIGSVEVDVNELHLIESNGSSTLRLLGPLEVKAETLKVWCQEIVMSGRIWMEARDYHQQDFVKIENSSGATTELGLGGVLADQYPWSAQEISADVVDGHVKISDPARLFVRLMGDRFGALPLVLTEKLELVDDDPRVTFLRRPYGSAIPEIIRSMINHDLASTDTLSAAGSSQLRIRFSRSWSDLDKMILAEDAEAALFAADLRAILS